MRKTLPEEENDAWDSWGRTDSGASEHDQADGGAAADGLLAGAIVDDHFGGVDVHTNGKAGAATRGGAGDGAAEQPRNSEKEDQDPVINQVEFYHSILMPLQDALAEEGDGDQPAVAAARGGLRGLSTSYLVAVLLEYIRSLHEHNIRVHHCFYTAVIAALTQCAPPRYYQLHQLLQYHVLDDSIYVAMQVLALKNQYPPAAQQGIDMLHRLGMHNDVVEVLLGERKVLRALKYAAARTETVTVPTQQYLEAAKATMDETTISAVAAFVGDSTQPPPKSAPPLRSV